MTDFAKLTAPFEADKIEWRIGSMTKDKSKGMAMAYIDARDVMERLDSVCGPDGWQNRYSHAEGKTICEIGIRCGEEWVWKADGAGDTDFEKEKGALSAAFKRAAVRWGVGRYLYDVPSLWVRVDQYKKIEKDEYPRLRTLLGGENVERSNGSTRPPARQQEPPPDIPLVDRLVRGIKDRSTIVGLDKFVTQASFVASFDELPDHERQLVQKNIDAKRKALSEGNPLAGG